MLLSLQHTTDCIWIYSIDFLVTGTMKLKEFISLSFVNYPWYDRCTSVYEKSFIYHRCTNNKFDFECSISVSTFNSNWSIDYLFWSNLKCSMHTIKWLKIGVDWNCVYVLVLSFHFIQCVDKTMIKNEKKAGIYNDGTY